jgi:predicted XRE-type DNA-binding protein
MNSQILVEKSRLSPVFDLGFPNAEREQLKARLTLRIYRFIKQRGLAHAQAGKILGMKQPHVSALMPTDLT